MKSALLPFALLFALLGSARAQTLDRKDFAAPQSLGATTALQGSGTVNGNATTIKQTGVFVGRTTINGVVTTRSDQTLQFAGITALSSGYLDDYESVYRTDVSVNGQSAESLTYSPALNPFPRFFSVGQQANYGTSLTGTLSGSVVVSGQIAGTITVAGVETVFTSVGAFEAIRATISFRRDLNWSNGFQQTIANRVVWLARGVGLVRFQSTESVAGSTGAPTTVSYDITLAATNYALTPQPVFPVAVVPAHVGVVGNPAHGGFDLSRSSGDLSAPLTVFYHNGGSAVPNGDYIPFPFSFTFAANQTQGVIPVQLLAGASRNRKVKVFLDPAPNGDYSIEKAQSKVFLSDLP